MAQIKFTSRASVKIKDSFYTFEACIERTCPDDMDTYSYNEFKKNLWDECNAEVDNQIIEISEYLKK